MKMRRIYRLFAMLTAGAMCLLLASCFNGNKQMEFPVSEALADDANHSANSSKQIIVYQINRTQFQEFLSTPSADVLDSYGANRLCYPQDGEWLHIIDLRRVPIKQQLLDFCGDVHTLEKCLTDRGISAVIERALMIDTPHVPLTLWLDTTAGNYYITVHNLSDEKPTYAFYSESEYRDMYLCAEASLYVNRKEVITDTPAIVYHNYADIPLLAVLEAMGADLKYESDMLTAISFQGTNYYLDTEKYRLYVADSESHNLIASLQGGTSFVYSVGRELMMDDAMLRATLENMGIDANITMDKEKAIVKIRIK